MLYGKLHARERRLMKNVRSAGDDGRELIVIANIHFVVRCFWMYPLLHPSARKIINDVHIKPARYELGNKVRTDKSGAACNNRFFHVLYITRNSISRRACYHTVIIFND